MLKSLKKILLGEPRPSGAGFRYGFLALIAVLLVFYASHASSQRGASGYIILLMLLLNHLAFSFRWPPNAALFVRVIALAWVVLGCVLILVR
jgi:hypothetical protein